MFRRLILWWGETNLIGQVFSGWFTGKIGSYHFLAHGGGGGGGRLVETGGSSKNN